MTTATKKYIPNPTFRIFRANKSNNGFASAFTLSPKTNFKGTTYLVFLEMAKQIGELDENGNANFAWRRKDANEKSSITMKLGNNDIGEILAVLNGKKKSVGIEGGKYTGLFHKNTKGSAFLDFKVFEKDGKVTGYSLEVGNKINDAKEWTKYRHSISVGEGELLKVFLEMCLIEINKWYFDSTNTYVLPAKKFTNKPAEPMEDEDPNDLLTQEPPDDIPF